MKIIYYTLIIFLLLTGIGFIRGWAAGKNNKLKIRFRKYRFRNARVLLQRTLENNNELFKGTGIPLTVYQYNLLRVAVFLLICFFRITGKGFSTDSAIIIIIIFFLFIITSPGLTILNKRMPFALLLNLLKRHQQVKIDEEIYKAVSQLKNLVIAQKDAPMSAFFLIEQITRFTKKTRMIFSKTLVLLHEEDQEAAVEYFKSASGTKLGNEFGNIISKLDGLNPAELKEHLMQIQSAVRDEKVTNRLRQQELFSNLIFIPIIAASMVIILNFVIITVWMDSIYNMLKF